MARRPRWLAALGAFLVLAAIFAALGQWQAERAVEQATIETPDTETPVPLADVIKPGGFLKLVDGGRRVTVDATWTGESAVVSGRKQGDRTGEWLLWNARRSDGACLPVAVGWSATVHPTEFVSITDSPSPLAGRIVASEDPAEGSFSTSTLTTIAAADLVNRWHCDTILDAYLVLDSAPAPLETIATAKPVPQAELNWLNIFYALEWSFFACFAFYFWYRLVKDAVEREAESAETAQP
jgi:cytochrome oxidase assembly protein ShyY1